MAIEVRVPELGGSVTHARLSTWLKKTGDAVSRGEPIAEVETDKTSVEIVAPADGVLVSILVPAGTDHVAVNDLLATISTDEASTPDVPPAGAAVSDGRSTAQVLPRNTGGGAWGGRTVPVEATPTEPEHRPGDDPADERVDASPLARRMAAAAGIALSAVPGTGPHGRVTKRDIDAALRPRPAATPPREAYAGHVLPVPAPDDDPTRYERVPLSAMRRVTAQRLAAAKQSIPHFYLHIDCGMDAVASVRAAVNARGGQKVSFTAFALRAAALALKKVPAANAMWDNGTIRLYAPVDLAVAVNTPSGLIAPVVRSAHEKSVSALNLELVDLADRARGGRLAPEEYAGGTCTVSNLGMFGITALYPILNPPQACILGLGAVEERAVVRDHAVTVGLVMTATLSADHRVLDGATGAALLATFRELIEDPWALLM